MLDITQVQLAAAIGVSRAHIAGIETGRANPSLDLVWRIADRLGLELELVGRHPIVVDRRQGDLVHARCSAYVERRLRRRDWLVEREVEVASGRAHGWVDLLAFEPRSRTLVIVEIKTRLDDIGAVERQVAWYEREAPDLAVRLGWRPRRVLSWLLLLASDEVEGRMSLHRELLRTSFPERAATMRAVVRDPTAGTRLRGIALIDPTGRRREWLIASRMEGRRSTLPYRDYADAARRIGGVTR
jgi:transcriptional regulator with XRE-family HTH domain